MKTYIIKLNIILLFSALLQPCFSQATRDSAQLLTAPESFTVNGAPDYLWYKYIADSSCTITLSTSFQISNDWPMVSDIFLYKDSVEDHFWENEGINCCSGSDFISRSNVSEVSTVVEAGDEIYIKIRKSWDASNLSISFNVTDHVLGTTFQNPLPALLDSVPMLISALDDNHSFIYFEFSPDHNMLANANFGEAWVREVYQKLPDGTIINVRGFYDKAVYAGETYIFEFPTIYTEDMNWYLMVDTVEVGYDCNIPIKITKPGVVEIESARGSEWVNLFAEKEGYYTIALDDTMKNKLNLMFSSGCYNDFWYRSYVDTSLTGEYTIYLPAGEEQKFNVSGADSGSSYNITLTYVASMLGDSCSTAIEIRQDSTYTQINPRSYYSFTPTKTGDYTVKVSELYNERGGINITDTCYGLQKQYGFLNGDESGNAQAKFTFKKDSTYILHNQFWEFSTPYIKFVFSEYTPIKGEFCSDAIEIEEMGSHRVDHPISDIWLQYVAEYSGTLYVSTRDSTWNDTNLEVFKEACDEIPEGNEDVMFMQNPYVEIQVEEGDTLLIKSNKMQWNYMGSYPITIGYTEMYKDGYDCEHPIYITDLPISDTIEYSVETSVMYYSIELEEDTEIVISDGNASNFLQIFSDCDTRIASSESGEFIHVLSSGEYTFQWFNTSGEDIVWAMSMNDNPDTDNDGTPNASDEDDDNDGVPDTEDLFPYNSNESVDTDGDGIGNFADTDDDGDGILDVYDMYPLQPISTSISENANTIAVYPNPVEAKFNVSGLDATKTYLLQIIDARGTVVFVEENYSERSTLEVSNLSSAIYTVVIQDVDNAYSTTFFKK